MSDDGTRIDPDEHRDVLLPVIERWFPDDDAPYDRIDELMRAARLGGFEPGVKEWAVEWWSARMVDAEAERDRLRAVVEAVRTTVGSLKADIDQWATTGVRRLSPGPAHDVRNAVDQALDRVLAQLDGSGITGGPRPKGDPVVFWNLINQHADEVPGPHGHSIRTWLDDVIRPALFGDAGHQDENSAGVSAIPPSADWAPVGATTGAQSISNVGAMADPWVEAARQAMQGMADRGETVVVSQDGKIVEVPASELLGDAGHQGDPAVFPLVTKTGRVLSYADVQGMADAAECANLANMAEPMCPCPCHRPGDAGHQSEDG